MNANTFGICVIFNYAYKQYFLKHDFEIMADTHYDY